MDSRSGAQRRRQRIVVQGPLGRSPTGCGTTLPSGVTPWTASSTMCIYSPI
ncbi:MAG TPA: hypothetical protein VIU11_25935 [Nakamurella sp.]